jgi:hypothetical protein
LPRSTKKKQRKSEKQIKEFWKAAQEEIISQLVLTPAVFQRISDLVRVYSVQKLSIRRIMLTYPMKLFLTERRPFQVLFYVKLACANVMVCLT